MCSKPMVPATETDASPCIDPRVVRRLNELAESFAGLGLRLFVFGSVAETYPAAGKGADLDLGVLVDEDLDPATRRERLRNLRRHLDELPTIRPVDLVEFDSVDPRFKEVALRSRIDFPLAENGRDA